MLEWIKTLRAVGNGWLYLTYGKGRNLCATMWTVMSWSLEMKNVYINWLKLTMLFVIYKQKNHILDFCGLMFQKLYTSKIMKMLLALKIITKEGSRIPNTCYLTLMCVRLLSHVWLLGTPWTGAHQALSMKFPRQEYWSGLSFPTPDHLLDSEIEPLSPASLHCR